MASSFLLHFFSLIQELLKDIHKEMNRLARQAGGPPQFRAVFQRLDRDGGGELDVPEFIDGLSDLGYDE